MIAGVPLALAAFRLLDERVEIRVDAEDGQMRQRGETVLYLSGHARGLLAAERTALNFLQHLSGIATLTNRFVARVRGTRAAIVDTRKTLPGWRTLQKYAVRCGGGVSHRADLAGAVLIKDNHLAAVDGDVALAIERARDFAPPGTPVQVEVETPGAGAHRRGRGRREHPARQHVGGRHARVRRRSRGPAASPRRAAACGSTRSARSPRPASTASPSGR